MAPGSSSGGGLGKSNSLPSLKEGGYTATGKKEGPATSMSEARSTMNHARYLRFLRQRREERHLIGRKDEIMSVLARQRCNIPSLDFTPQSPNRLVRKAHVRAIAEACAPLLTLETRRTLAELSEGQVGDGGAAALADVLPLISALTHLNVAGNGIGDRGGKALAAALGKEDTLRTINLAMNHLSSASCSALAGALGSSASLQRLVLRGNCLQPGGARLLAPGLLATRTLQELSLRSCAIGDAGAVALAAAITAACPLAKLDLSHNSIRGEGGRAVAGALARSRCLVDLNLCDNPVQGDAAAVLAAAVVESFSLATFNTLSLEGLRHDGVTHVSVRCMAPGAHVIAHFLGDGSKSLRGLNFAGCALDDAAVLALARAVEASGNTSIQEIQLGDDGGQCVVPAEVVEQGGSAVVALMRALAASPGAPKHGAASRHRAPGAGAPAGGVELRRVKWMLLGRGEAGKTSLYKTLSGECTTLMGRDDRTVGLDVYNYRPAGDGGLVVSVWDYAGQEVYWRVGNASYLTERRTLYVLVFDASCSRPASPHSLVGAIAGAEAGRGGGGGSGGAAWGEEQEMEWVAHWTRLLLIHAPGSVVQIVAAKADLVPDDAVLRRRAQLALDTFDRTQIEQRVRVQGHIEACRVQLDEMGVYEESLRHRNEGRRADAVGERRAALAAEVTSMERQLSKHLRRAPACASVSCKDVAAVEALGRELTGLCENATLFPDLRNIVPSNWAALLREVEGLQAGGGGGGSDDEGGEAPPGYGWEGFKRKFKARLGFSSDDAIGAAVSFLHDCGVCLRFQSEPVLRGLVVVRPQWLADVIRQVVRTDFSRLEKASKLAKRMVMHLKATGVLEPELLPFMWAAIDPPPPKEFFPKLTTILTAFEVAIPLDAPAQGAANASAAAAPSLLVPCFLPKAPGRRAAEAWPSSLEPHEVIIGVMVHLEPSPPGLFERLLVRTRGIFDLQPGAWRGEGGPSSGGGGIGAVDAGAVLRSPRVQGVSLLLRVDGARMMCLGRLTPSQSPGWFEADAGEGAAAAAAELRWLLDEAEALLQSRYPGVAHGAELLCSRCLTAAAEVAHRPQHAMSMRKVPIVTGGWEVPVYREQRAELELAMTQDLLRTGRQRDKERAYDEATSHAEGGSPKPMGLSRRRLRRKKTVVGTSPQKSRAGSPTRAPSPEPPLSLEVLEVLESALRCRCCDHQERRWDLYDILAGDRRMDLEYDVFLCYRRPFEAAEDDTYHLEARRDSLATRSSDSGDAAGAHGLTPISIPQPFGGGGPMTFGGAGADRAVGVVYTPGPATATTSKRMARRSSVGWEKLVNMDPQDNQAPSARDQEIAQELLGKFERRMIRPFMDVRCIRPGSRWGSGAVRALIECSVMVVLVSEESLRALRRIFASVAIKAQMGGVTLEDHRTSDPVLSEWIIGLELKALGLVHRIQPVFTGGRVAGFLEDGGDEVDGPAEEPGDGGGGGGGAGGAQRGEPSGWADDLRDVRVHMQEAARLSALLPANVVPTHAIDEAQKLLGVELRHYGISRPSRWVVAGAAEGDRWSLRGVLEALVLELGEPVRARDAQLAREIERVRRWEREAAAEGGERTANGVGEGRASTQDAAAEALGLPPVAGASPGPGMKSGHSAGRKGRRRSTAALAQRFSHTEWGPKGPGRGVLSSLEVAAVQKEVLARQNVLSTRLHEPLSGEMHDALLEVVRGCAGVVTRAQKQRRALLRESARGRGGTSPPGRSPSRRIEVEEGPEGAVWSPVRARKSAAQIKKEQRLAPKALLDLGTPGGGGAVTFSSSSGGAGSRGGGGGDKAYFSHEDVQDVFGARMGVWDDSAHEFEAVWAVIINVRPGLEADMVSKATNAVAQQFTENKGGASVLLAYERDLRAERHVTSANHPGMATAMLVANMGAARVLACASLEDDHITVMSRGERAAEALAAVGVREVVTTLEAIVVEQKLSCSIRLVCSHCLRDPGRMRPGWTQLDVEDVGVFPMREVLSREAHRQPLVCPECTGHTLSSRGLSVLCGQARGPRKGRLDALITSHTVLDAQLVEQVYLTLRNALLVPFWALREGLGVATSGPVVYQVGDDEDSSEGGGSEEDAEMHFMPVVSNAAVEKMKEEIRSREVEGLLLEWVLALAFHEAGRIEFVMPLYPDDPPVDVDAIPPHLYVPESTLERASGLVSALGIPYSQVEAKVPRRIAVRSLVKKATAWPGVRLGGLEVPGDMTSVQVVERVVQERIVVRLYDTIRL